jgi:hypothetical protein
MIDSKKGIPGQTIIFCSICEKQDLLLNWMPCDMWNGVVREFKEEHKNCGEVNGQTSL